ncbi:MAG: nickel ABC transporter permease [Chloroflexota bacterium]|nr:nickel ABC transporter permease [Chloroflexota bacterium]
MRQYLLRRVISLLPVLLGVSLITFGLMGLVPGDPAEILASYGKEVEPTVEEVEAVRAQLGLDQPLPIRYTRWLGRVVRGDLGQSLCSGGSVWREITVRLPATLELTAGGMIVGLLIALPVGILAAVQRDGVVDQLSRALALLGASVPAFWLGTMLILLFAVYLGWLPAIGRGGLRHFILPSLALGLGTSAVLMRLIRASLLEVLDQDYVRTARAKGLRERAVVLRHALKPSLLPVVTVLGLQFGRLLGGAVIVETIFAWPGLGMFIIESILARDFPVIQGFALFMSLVFVAINFAVDILYHWLDPRIQYGT